MRIAVFQLGARRHYAIPCILSRAGMLDRLYTDLCSNVGWPHVLDRIVPGWARRGALARLLDRRVPDVPAGQITTYPRYGLRRFLHRRKATDASMLARDYVRANEAFGRMVTAGEWGRAEAVYVFNGAGLEVLQAGRTRGLRCFMEQTLAPFAHTDALLEEERQRWTGWEADGLPETEGGLLAERERREWELADRILCGSDYVVDTVRTVGGPASKCVVVPYGLDAGCFHPIERVRHGGPLRVLYAGSLELRKGIQYLRQALEQLDESRVVVRAVGPVRLTREAQARLRACMDVHGAVARSEMIEHYAWADVLVHPSLAEGSANVTYEALATGLPVITTSAAGSVVRDGHEGFIVPIRSAEALAERLAELASNRDRVDDLSRSALARATAYTWADYERRLIAALVDEQDKEHTVTETYE